MYDTLVIEEGVSLPEFPQAGDPGELSWQTKDIGMPILRTFKLTADGRLLRRETEQREMTDKELDEMAAEDGYESWDDWKESDGFGPLESWKYTTDKEFWLDHSMHGSFEFHANTKRLDNYDDFYWSYEARFTRGELDEIVFLGDRFSD